VIAFEPLVEGDLPLVREWLGRGHVHRWWRDPVDQDIAEMHDALAGRDPTSYYLIVLDGRPIGLIQTYRVSDHPDWEEVVNVGRGVAGLDLFIGEPDLIGRGHGPRILGEFARRVVLTDPELHAVVAAVDEENRRSWRAFEKAGFRYVRDVEEEGRPHRLMRLDRPAP
jgi:aminoglycoside 6'-N-acetyltransferase